MRKILLLACFLCLVALPSHARMNVMVVGGQSAAGCASGSNGGDIINETFDTEAGYDDTVWTEANDVDPNPDYTASPVGSTPFCGESFHSDSDDEWVKGDFGSSYSHFYMSFYVNFISEAIGASEYITIHQIRGAAIARVAIRVYDDDNDGDIDLHFITKIATDRGTVADLSLDTPYKVRIEYNEAGASDSASMYVYNISDVLVGSVSVSGADYLDGDVDDILFGAYSGSGGSEDFEMLIDNLQIDSSGYIF